MKLVDKIKNMFTEEVEEPVIKKEVMKVEIESPVVEEKEEEPVIVKEEKPAPVFFDDEDFETLEKPKIEKEEEKPIIKEIYKGNKEDEVKKVFRPSPIISPVYGVLDKNYSKEDISDSKSSKLTPYEYSSFTVDEVRKKAYGTLEDDVEITLFGKEEPKHEKKEDEPVIEENESIIDEPVIDNDDFDLSDDIMNSYQDEEEEKEVTDEDLFNLIDSMYDKEDNE